MADPRKEEKSFMQPNSRQRCTYVTTKEGGWVGLTHQKIWNIADTA